jgi:hypothetical protein
MVTTLRLSEVLARNVEMEWFEAVAIVSEVADRVREGLGGQRIPELDQVHLSTDGTLTLTGATRTDEPVRRFGQLLHACLVQCDPPVQLRLTVSQATAPEPGFSTIREFSEALAYFERPDRPAVLRNLLARAAAAPAPKVTMVPTLDAIAPLPVPERTKQADKGHGRNPRPSRRAVAGIAGIVLLVIAATAYSQLNAGTPAAANVSALAVKASDAVGTTLVKGMSAVSESVGLGRFVPAEGSGAPLPATRKPAEPPKRSNVTRTSKKDLPAAASLRIFDLREPPSVGTPQPAPLRVPDEIVTIVAQSPLEGDTAGLVYSADDQTVVEPVGVRPQLPRVLPADVRTDQLSRIELVILPDGTVGSVKLLSERGGVLEGMLLSAAKAWKFTPAMKDGKAVSYRKSVWLVLND